MRRAAPPAPGPGCRLSSTVCMPCVWLTLRGRRSPMGDVPWMRDTHTVHVRQRVGRALVIGGARKQPLLKVLIRVSVVVWQLLPEQVLSLQRCWTWFRRPRVEFRSPVTPTVPATWPKRSLPVNSKTRMRPGWHELCSYAENSGGGDRALFERADVPFSRRASSTSPIRSFTPCASGIPPMFCSIRIAWISLNERIFFLSFAAYLVRRKLKAIGGDTRAIQGPEHAHKFIDDGVIDAVNVVYDQAAPSPEPGRSPMASGRRSCG